MPYSMRDQTARSVGLVSNQSNDHAVKVEEEHDEVETKFNKGFLVFPHVSGLFISCGCFAHDGMLTFLCTFNLRKISVASRRCWLSIILRQELA